jgi:diguanylate cyclase (GGDEF)-like protein
MNSPHRVIVIDDEPVVRQYLQVALTDMGCHVEVFDSQESGLKRCDTVDFDVVFVDKNLPDGTGLSICQKLSQSDCKVALITGYANLSSAVEAMRLGVAEYFIKPIDLDDLEARLLRMLEVQKLERENRALLDTLKAQCRALEEVATRDPLTGLFNHTHFIDRIRSEIARGRSETHFAVALIALDRFSEVNRAVGTLEGDAILREVGQLLGGGRLESSANALGVVEVQDVAGRVGGDTFSLLLPGASRGAAARKLQRLRSRLCQSVTCSGARLSASVGLAQYPEDGADAQALLTAAHAALETAKGAGGDTLICYRQGAPDDPHTAAGEVRRVRALGRSLTNTSFRFVYQPIVDIRRWEPLAYEALCRPTDEDFAHVGELLETAGRTGRLEELGRTLRRLAIQPLPELAAGCLMFINIHPQDLFGPSLVAGDSPLHSVADRIVLEITETQAIGDFAQARTRLQQLRSLGYRVAIDDFGAGYSGFNSLALLEPDFVKLDMGIVRGIRAGTRAARLTRHVREFCEGEEISVIAEGVETHDELNVLRALGIRYLQGYVFARPAAPFCGLAPQPPSLVPAAAASEA